MTMTDDEKLQRREQRLADVHRRTEGLRRWRDSFGVGAITHLERETGMTFAAVSRIVHGKAQPSTETAQAIERATGGAVRAIELLGLADPQEPTPIRRVPREHDESLPRHPSAGEGSAA